MPSPAAPGGSAADAHALAAVHLAVTGTREGASRYVELAAVEGRTVLDGDRVVVTVLAVVLEGAEGTWAGRGIARYAVPLHAPADGVPTVLAEPWPLPAPDRAPGGGAADSSQDPAGGEPDDGDGRRGRGEPDGAPTAGAEGGGPGETAAGPLTDAAASALAAAGYADVVVEGIASVGGDVYRVTALALPPGESAARRVGAWWVAAPVPHLLGLPAGAGTEPADTPPAGEAGAPPADEPGTPPADGPPADEAGTAPAGTTTREEP